MPDISDARACASAIRHGDISSLELVEACLARISAREDLIGAWAFLDADLARRRARFADDWRAQGLPLGPLHGVPVGVKDVFDTADMPSEYGSPIHRGRRPERDAAAVARLRAAGAIVIGKTVTSEFGMYHPSRTRNPRNVDRSAGVSSSGSAAAIADSMVPLALGTQHTASTLLPASFCGVVGFKPSFGFVDMSGSNILVPRLAQIGFLANTVADVALLAGSFKDEMIAVRPALRLAAVRGPAWALVDADAADVFGRWIDAQGIRVLERPCAAALDRSVDIIRGLLDAHMAARFGDDQACIDHFCPPLQQSIGRGRTLTAAQFIALSRAADDASLAVDDLFDGADVLVTLAAPGEAAPYGEPGVGALTMPWSLCGLPTMSLPLLRGRSGLPIGLQLIGRRGHDATVLACAAALEQAAGMTTRVTT
jgi:Asp-tRNA(Asn)/Glu-tRNA(Gln) amidotransferase A subunit family amidase